MDELNCTAGAFTETLLISYLFTFFVRSDQLYKQSLDADKDTFEAEFGRIEPTCREKNERRSSFPAVKQLLVSLCKSCLQGSQTVEVVVRIFGEIQVSSNERRKRTSRDIHVLGNRRYTSDGRRATC